MTVTVSVTVTDPTADQAQEIGALIGLQSSSASTPSAPPVNYFPADSATAPFPSPEGSRIVIQNGAATGEPYILDKSGVVYSFGPTPVAIPMGTNVFAAGCYKIYINAAPTNFGADEIIICQQIMWMHQGAKWFFINSNGGLSGNLTSLPPFFTAGTTAAPVPPMPSAPAAVSPAPGSGTTVNTSTTIAAAIAASSAGGTVSVAAGTFNESDAIPVALKIAGGGSVSNPGTATAAFSGAAIVDGTGLADPTGYAHQLGGLVPMTDCIIDGLEIRGFGLKEATGGGTAGIRNGGVSNLTINNCYIHDNQDGVFSGGFNATVTMNNSLLQNNGLGGGQTHNIYISTGVVSAAFNNVTSIVPPQSANSNRSSGLMNGGHAFKSRANVTSFNGGYAYAADASPIDIPDGSTQPCVIKGMTIEKKAGDANHCFFGYAAESQTNGTAGVQFVGCTFILNCDAPFIQSFGGPVSFDSTCVWQGNKPTASGGGVVTGLPV